MANTINTIGGLNGTKTKFHSDVKMSVSAGMEFGTKNYKMRVVGYEIFRHYFDSVEKDCQVGSQRMKRVIYNR
jgi:hypothetical protein